jgi:hypothetical protein
LSEGNTEKRRVIQRKREREKKRERKRLKTEICYFKYS